MDKLQYATLRKCTDAVVEARKESVRKVAAVGRVEMFARATARRFLARSMCDPSRAGVAQDVNNVIEGMVDLSLGGPCWRGEVVVIEVGVGSGVRTKSGRTRC